MIRSNVNLTAKPVSFNWINKEFVKAKCYVMALGKNRNFTHIGREAADAAMSSLSYIPVVAHVIYDDDEEKLFVGGHDYEIVHEGNTIDYKSLTIPYGVVVADSFSYEPVTEPDGTQATYLTADVIMWAGRYPELMETIYSDDVYWNQSMEINVNTVRDYPEDHRYSDITSYSYSCLTLLGKDDDPEFNTEPCFQSARVEPIKFSLDNSFLEKFEELKNELSNIDMTFANLGGETTMENEKITPETTEEFEEIENAEVEETEVEEVIIEEDVIEETEVKDEGDDESFSADAVEEVVDDAVKETEEITVDEAEEPGEDEPKVDYAATYMEKVKALCQCMPKDDDEKRCCHMLDFDDSYVYYCIMDWECGEESYVRYAYEFDSESLTASLVGEPIDMIMKLLTKEENKAIEDARISLETELAALKEFKDAMDAAELEAEIEAIFAEFEDLKDEEEFKMLKDNCTGMSKEEIKEKCYAIRGRKCSPKHSYSLDKTDKVKIPASVNDINNATKKNNRYGDLFERYGAKK